MMLPCERPCYIHVCIGGPFDGMRTPSRHLFQSIQQVWTDGRSAVYLRDGEPEPCCSDGVEMLLMMDEEYAEVRYFRVRMIYKTS